MKAERRHELKINTLDDALAKMHAQWRRWATWGVTTLILSILVIVLVRTRMVNNAMRQEQAHQDMGVVQLELTQIKLAIASGRASSTSQFYRDITSRLDSILQTVGSGNPPLAAQALVAEGEVDWTMAGAAAATTQPMLDQPSSSELLKSAQVAYQQAITTYPQEHFWAANAHLGLAAVAENNHDWAEARKHYQAVIDDSALAGEVLANLATSKLNSLDRLQNAPVIGLMQATPLNVNLPTTLPALGPATAPMMPATQK